MANNHYDLSSIYTAADKYTVLQLLNALLDKVKDLEITDVDVNKTAVNKFKLVFTFADNTTMETPEFALEYDIVNVEIVNGHLIFTFDGDNTYDAGNLKGVTNFAINSSQHLIVNYQDGTSQDLGAIFNGNVNIDGNLTITGTAKILENIVDANGHYRFIEDEIENSQPLRIVSSYAKWSLSGTHLMVVFAGYVMTGESILNGNNFFRALSIPSWIMNKIYPVGTSNTLSRGTVIFYDATWQTEIGSCPVRFAKGSSSLLCDAQANYAAAQDSYFRLQFDLLIDNA